MSTLTYKLAWSAIELGAAGALAYVFDLDYLPVCVVLFCGVLLGGFREWLLAAPEAYRGGGSPTSGPS